MVFLELFNQKKQLEQQTERLDKKVAEFLETNRQLEETNNKLEELSNIDALTGLANRRRFETFLAFEWKRAEREAQPLSVILADIDFFKAFNDNRGHLAGDLCLKTVAGVMASTVGRPMALVARFGGRNS